MADDVSQIYSVLKTAGLKAAITGRSRDEKYAVHRRGYVVGWAFGTDGNHDALAVHFEYERWYLRDSRGRDFGPLYTEANAIAANVLTKAGYTVEIKSHHVLIHKPQAK